MTSLSDRGPWELIDRHLESGYSGSAMVSIHKGPLDLTLDDLEVIHRGSSNFFSVDMKLGYC